MFTNNTTRLLSALIVAAGGTLAIAGDFELRSYSIDGGGGASIGGTFEVTGTIGQTDADYLAGGEFELEGGFWVSTTTPACSCLGDMNGDGARNGADIQQFVSCLLVGGDCQCANVDGMAGIDVSDTTAFVDVLLNVTACP